MGTTLNPQDPSNFSQEGSQSFTTGTVLTLNDTSVGDFISFFALDADAAAGVEVDVIATFQVSVCGPVNADAGNRIVINDGTTQAVAACIVQNGVRGIGLLGQGTASDPAAYPFFVPVDWTTAPTTIRLRRTATGDAELVEVNGVAPTTRALLAAASLPASTRGSSAFEFGAASPEAKCTVAYSAFRSERVVLPVAGTLNFTRLRLNDADSTDWIRLRADYTLGAGSNGVNPSTEPVTVKLSTAAGQFYPTPDFNPLNGFDVGGATGKRRWKLNDAERARAHIEACNIDEDPANGGAFILRDLNTTLASVDYSTVNVEITIGGDKLLGTAQMVQKPGSGKWRLKTEP